MESAAQQSFDANNFSPQPYAHRNALASAQSNRGNNLASRKGKKDDIIQSKYDTRLADAALRQAAEGGYLISPSRAFLLERCSTADQETQSLHKIEYLHLAHFHVRTLGYIQSCRHLKVCILHNNYLTRFSALENCPHLIRLDLHSNQITKLPDEPFWSQMQNLKILNLHDNGIGKLEYVQALAACPNLLALTLYDTPLSLKPNYRHHTVNSIWSLKALDHHVVGDDEIIEDALFSKRFSAMNPRLYVELCPKEIEPAQLRTLEIEMQVVRKILSDINKRFVRGSPVVVIQRWVRGHLCRKKRNISYFKVCEKMRKLNIFAHETPSESHGGEAFSLDYDTYLKNRRPGSKTPSASTTLTHHCADTPNKAAIADDKEILPYPKDDDFDLKLLPPSLHINLAKLHQNALRSFDNSPDEQNITIHVHKEIDLPPQSLFSKPLSLSFEKQKVEKASKPLNAPLTAPASALKAQRKEPVTVQQMLGPQNDLVHHVLAEPHPVFGTLVEGGNSHREVGIQFEGDEEIPNHDWRIHDKTFQVSGGRPIIAELDPVQDKVLMNREAGRDVRDALDYWHDQELLKPKPQAKRTKPPPRLKDHVSLATLVAVSKAYRDRDKTDNIATKVDRVMKVQQERMQAKQIVSAFKDEKRTAALNQRQEDRLRIAEAIQQFDANKATYLEYAQERKERALQRHRNRHQELMFAADFGNQHMSVSNALIRHDRQAAKDDVRMQKGQLVDGIKLQLSEQADLVRRYMEHKQLMRQMAGAQDKSKIETRLLQEANDRIMTTRQRVAGKKARKAAIQAYQHSLPATAQPGPWPLVVSRNIVSVPSKGPAKTSLPELQDAKQTTAFSGETIEADFANDAAQFELPPMFYPSTNDDFASRQMQPMSSSVALQS
ncbi:uncharacterized protein LOC143469311 [Clavelina lepadiformis]|uniref:uncharacterized protein LOC143469311 n=1 Tax=Clavelina lepadiformis TaxID=159417 RepID=UPI0040425E10